jgi:hypothetical protein
MTTDAAQPQQRTDRITRWLLIAIGIYSGLLVTLLNVFLLGSGKTIDGHHLSCSLFTNVQQR